LPSLALSLIFIDAAGDQKVHIMTITKIKSASGLISQEEKFLKETFEQIDAIALANQKRVLQAFQNNRLSEGHFAECTGPGLHDNGRGIIDKIYAETMQSETAAVRLQFVSGTHAIACALFGNLKPGQRMVSLTGRPYDTLQPVIGLTGANSQSLIASGVLYEELDFNELLALVDQNQESTKLIQLLEQPTTLVHIQKSRGYSISRRALTNKEIAKLCRVIHSHRPDVVIMVDNCYGEFVEADEPTACGADLVAGSLIKNPGGGLAITGGYVAGKTTFVEAALTRLTAPGLDGKLGVLFNQNRLILQGFFMAPNIVAGAVKGAMLSASVLEKIGFKVRPEPLGLRSDIVQTVEFADKDALISFCQAVQASSPVDSHVLPEPAPMPGYSDEVIMAAGTFVQCGSIELSADGPLRRPYVAYMQGGLTYEHIKCMLENVLEYMRAFF
jgi:cystathionine beta-lyase family protein involved in aluminum resistance